jgi:hypothetical protein
MGLLCDLDYSGAAIPSFKYLDTYTSYSSTLYLHIFAHLITQSRLTGMSPQCLVNVGNQLQVSILIICCAPLPH